MVAEHGKMDRPGWAAVDNIALIREECMLLPQDAAVSSPAPTESTTVPPFDDEWCTFQEDLCNLTVSGTGDFLFTRTKGSDAAQIGTDHHFNAEGYFMFAESKSDEPGNVMTYIETKKWNGDEHPIECFHFWFFLDGFLVYIAEAISEMNYCI